MKTTEIDQNPDLKFSPLLDRCATAEQHAGFPDAGRGLLQPHRPQVLVADR